MEADLFPLSSGAQGGRRSREHEPIHTAECGRLTWRGSAVPLHRGANRGSGRRLDAPSSDSSAHCPSLPARPMMGEVSLPSPAFVPEPCSYWFSSAPSRRPHREPPRLHFAFSAVTMVPMASMSPVGAQGVKVTGPIPQVTWCLAPQLGHPTWLPPRRHICPHGPWYPLPSTGFLADDSSTDE